MNAEVIPKNVREMPRNELEDAVVRRTRERDELLDCGQAGVCANAPGCMRHWAERNAEMSRLSDANANDYAELVASLSKLEGGHWYNRAAELADNLTAVQGRCTELLEEARALRAKVARIHAAYREVCDREFIPSELAVAVEETGVFQGSR